MFLLDFRCSTQHFSIGKPQITENHQNGHCNRKNNAWEPPNEIFSKSCERAISSRKHDWESLYLPILCLLKLHGSHPTIATKPKRQSRISRWLKAPVKRRIESKSSRGSPCTDYLRKNTFLKQNTSKIQKNRKQFGGLLVVFRSLVITRKTFAK